MSNYIIKDTTIINEGQRISGDVLIKNNRIERVGGVPERILAASNVVLQVAGGKTINGVIGFVSHHLTPPEDKYKVKPINECYVDIGAVTSKEVAAAGVRVGTPVIYRPSFEKLLNK